MMNFGLRRMSTPHREREVPFDSIQILNANVTFFAFEVSGALQVVADRLHATIDGGFGGLWAGFPAFAVDGCEGAGGNDESAEDLHFVDERLVS